MTLVERINEDIKTAMKAKDKDTLKVVRMLKAALQKEQLESKEALTAEQELTIVARELKQRKDSLNEFEKANRQDLVAPLLDEIKIVEQYLPKQLSEDEVKAVISELITSLTSEDNKPAFGVVMGQAMAKLKGQADGQVVNRIVKELLS